MDNIDIGNGFSALELFPFDLAEIFSRVSSWVSAHNPFAGIQFSDLYDWLPGDIQAVCQALIVFSIIMFVFGIIKRLPLL